MSREGRTIEKVDDGSGVGGPAQRRQQADPSGRNGTQEEEATGSLQASDATTLAPGEVRKYTFQLPDLAEDEAEAKAGKTKKTTLEGLEIFAPGFGYSLNDQRFNLEELPENPKYKPGIEKNEVWPQYSLKEAVALLWKQERPPKKFNAATLKEQYRKRKAYTDYSLSDLQSAYEILLGSIQKKFENNSLGDSVKYANKLKDQFIATFPSSVLSEGYSIVELEEQFRADKVDHPQVFYSVENQETVVEGGSDASETSVPYQFKAVSFSITLEHAGDNVLIPATVRIDKENKVTVVTDAGLKLQDVAIENLDTIRMQALREYINFVKEEKGGWSSSHGFSRFFDNFGKQPLSQEFIDACSTYVYLQTQQLGLYPSWMSEHVKNIDPLLADNGFVEGTRQVMQKLVTQLTKSVKELLSDENFSKGLYALKEGYEKVGQGEEQFLMNALVGAFNAGLYYDVFRHEYGNGKANYPELSENVLTEYLTQKLSSKFFIYEKPSEALMQSSEAANFSDAKFSQLDAIVARFDSGASEATMRNDLLAAWDSVLFSRAGNAPFASPQTKLALIKFCSEHNLLEYPNAVEQFSNIRESKKDSDAIHDLIVNSDPISMVSLTAFLDFKMGFEIRKDLKENFDIKVDDMGRIPKFEDLTKSQKRDKKIVARYQALALIAALKEVAKQKSTPLRKKDYDVVVKEIHTLLGLQTKDSTQRSIVYSVTVREAIEKRLDKIFEEHDKSAKRPRKFARWIKSKLWRNTKEKRKTKFLAKHQDFIPANAVAFCEEMRKEAVRIGDDAIKQMKAAETPEEVATVLARTAGDISTITLDAKVRSTDAREQNPLEGNSVMGELEVIKSLRIRQLTLVSEVFNNFTIQEAEDLELKMNANQEPTESAKTALELAKCIVDKKRYFLENKGIRAGVAEELFGSKRRDGLTEEQVQEIGTFGHQPPVTDEERESLVARLQNAETTGLTHSEKSVLELAKKIIGLSSEKLKGEALKERLEQDEEYKKAVEKYDNGDSPLSLADELRVHHRMFKTVRPEIKAVRQQLLAATKAKKAALKIRENPETQKTLWNNIRDAINIDLDVPKLIDALGKLAPALYYPESEFESTLNALLEEAEKPLALTSDLVAKLNGVLNTLDYLIKERPINDRFSRLDRHKAIAMQKVLADIVKKHYSEKSTDRGAEIAEHDVSSDVLDYFNHPAMTLTLEGQERLESKVKGRVEEPAYSCTIRYLKSIEQASYMGMSPAEKDNYKNSKLPESFGNSQADEVERALSVTEVGNEEESETIAPVVAIVRRLAEGLNVDTSVAHKLLMVNSGQGYVDFDTDEWMASTSEFFTRNPAATQQFLACMKAHQEELDFTVPSMPGALEKSAEMLIPSIEGGENCLRALPNGTLQHEVTNHINTVMFSPAQGKVSRKDKKPLALIKKIFHIIPVEGKDAEVRLVGYRFYALHPLAEPLRDLVGAVWTDPAKANEEGVKPDINPERNKFKEAESQFNPSGIYKPHDYRKELINRVKAAAEKYLRSKDRGAETDGIEAVIGRSKIRSGTTYQARLILKVIDALEEKAAIATEADYKAAIRTFTSIRDQILATSSSAPLGVSLQEELEKFPTMLNDAETAKFGYTIGEAVKKAETTLYGQKWRAKRFKWGRGFRSLQPADSVVHDKCISVDDTHSDAWLEGMVELGWTYLSGLCLDAKKETVVARSGLEEITDKFALQESQKQRLQDYNNFMLEVYAEITKAKSEFEKGNCSSDTLKEKTTAMDKLEEYSLDKPIVDRIKNDAIRLITFKYQDFLNREKAEHNAIVTGFANAATEKMQNAIDKNKRNISDVKKSDTTQDEGLGLLKAGKEEERLEGENDDATDDTQNKAEEEGKVDTDEKLAKVHESVRRTRGAVKEIMRNLEEKISLEAPTKAQKETINHHLKILEEKEKEHLTTLLKQQVNAEVENAVSQMEAILASNSGLEGNLSGIYEAVRTQIIHKIVPACLLDDGMAIATTGLKKLASAYADRKAHLEAESLLKPEASVETAKEKLNEASLENLHKTAKDQKSIINTTISIDTDASKKLKQKMYAEILNHTVDRFIDCHRLSITNHSQDVEPLSEKFNEMLECAKSVSKLMTMFTPDDEAKKEVQQKLAAFVTETYSKGSASSATSEDNLNSQLDAFTQDAVRAIKASASGPLDNLKQHIKFLLDAVKASQVEEGKEADSSPVSVFRKILKTTARHRKAHLGVMSQLDPIKSQCQQALNRANSPEKMLEPLVTAEAAIAKVVIIGGSETEEQQKQEAIHGLTQKAVEKLHAGLVKSCSTDDEGYETWLLELDKVIKRLSAYEATGANASAINVKRDALKKAIIAKSSLPEVVPPLESYYKDDSSEEDAQQSDLDALASRQQEVNEKIEKLSNMNVIDNPGLRNLRKEAIARLIDEQLGCHAAIHKTAHKAAQDHHLPMTFEALKEARGALDGLAIPAAGYTRQQDSKDRLELVMVKEAVDLAVNAANKQLKTAASDPKEFCRILLQTSMAIFKLQTEESIKSNAISKLLTQPRVRAILRQEASTLHRWMDDIFPAEQSAASGEVEGSANSLAKLEDVLNRALLPSEMKDNLLNKLNPAGGTSAEDPAVNSNPEVPEGQHARYFEAEDEEFKTLYNKYPDVKVAVLKAWDGEEYGEEFKKIFLDVCKEVGALLESSASAEGKVQDEALREIISKILKSVELSEDPTSAPERVRNQLPRFREDDTSFSDSGSESGPNPEGGGSLEGAVSQNQYALFSATSPAGEAAVVEGQRSVVAAKS